MSYVLMLSLLDLPVMGRISTSLGQLRWNKRNAHIRLTLGCHSWGKAVHDLSSFHRGAA